MPQVKRTQKWEETLKEDVRALGRGWSVQEFRGKMRLKWRYVKGRKDQTVMLNFLWESGARKAATTRIGNIFNLTLEGHDSSTAAKIAEGKAPKINYQWSKSLSRFKTWKTKHDTNISEATWDHDYRKVLSMAVDLLEGKDSPTNAADLIDLCVRKWEPGSATRKRRAGNLCQFLTYCVERENAPIAWQPPTNKKIHVGRKPADAKTQKKDPITDKEIIDLIEAISATPAGRRWADVLRFWAVYGLRPVEIKHLHIKTDNETGEPYLWCSYQKRSGGGVSPARRLMPLLLEGHNWNLLPRLQAGLIEFPSMTSKNGVAEVARKYLERRAAWNSLVEKVKARDEQLGTYSFRHSYSVRGHRLGIDSGSMAKAMGHSEEVHGREYPWATKESMISAFQRAEAFSLAKSP